MQAQHIFICSCRALINIGMVGRVSVKLTDVAERVVAVKAERLHNILIRPSPTGQREHFVVQYTYMYSNLQLAGRSERHMYGNKYGNEYQRYICCLLLRTCVMGLGSI